MKKITRQLQKATQDIGLATAERSLMRERVVTYMEYKPLRPHTTPPQRVRTPAQHPVFSYFRAHHFSGAVAIALIVTTSTFGISSAATNALPGDLLYPVKINVNEGVVSMMHTSQESRLLWERERAERRLLEASELVVQGRLGEDAQDQVTMLFNKHSEAVVEQVKQVEQEDPVRAAELSDDFEQALDTHEAVLTRLMVDESGAVDEGALGLVEQVKSMALEAEKMRESAEQMIGEDEEVPVEAEEAQAETVGTVDSQYAGEEAPPLVSESEQASSELTVRQRAATRAAERALKNRTLAEEAVRASVVSDERAALVGADIEAGNRLIEEASDLEREGKHKQAYRAYREASAVFQQVAQLAQASERFDIAIVVPPAASTSKATPRVTSEPTQGADDVDDTGGEQVSDVMILPVSLEDQASTTIAEVERRIAELVAGGLEPGYADNARVMLKDAHASYVRARVAQGLGDTASAEQLYEFAITQSDRIGEYLSTMTTLESTEEDQEGSTSTIDGLIVSKEATSSDMLPWDGVLLYHELIDNMHVFEGILPIPTPCHTANVTATTSGDERNAIQFDADVQDGAREGEACVQVLSQVRFDARVDAPSTATTSEFRVNGEPVVFQVIERTMISPSPDEVPDQEPASSTSNTTVAPASLFERAFKNTQSIFIGQ